MPGKKRGWIGTDCEKKKGVTRNRETKADPNKRETNEKKESVAVFFSRHTHNGGSHATQPRFCDGKQAPEGPPRGPMVLVVRVFSCWQDAVSPPPRLPAWRRRIPRPSPTDNE